MPKVEVQLLGNFAVRTNSGTAVRFPTQKSRALFGYIALHPGQQQPREKLIDLLWGSREESHARNSLSQAITALRKCLGPASENLLSAEYSSLTYTGNPNDVDAVVFQRLVAGGTSNEFAEAVELYSGELMADCNVGDPVFTDWLDFERARIRTLYLSALSALLDHQVEREVWHDVFRTSQRLLKLEPLQEDAHRALMKYYAANDQVALALKQFGSCAAALKQELGIMPGDETSQLYAELIAKRSQLDKTIRFNELYPHDDNAETIAVLPFVNMSGDLEQEYFADGVAEDLTASLSKLPQLFVIARNSSFRYKGKTRKAQQIADELGVRYVIEGSIRKAGNRVRITAQLIDCGTGGYLWADRYDRDLTDIFAVQDEVTQEIVTALALELSADDQQKVIHQITDNLEAYDYFLRGREQHWRLSRESSAQAKILLKRAIALDPNCAAAHAVLGDSYLFSYIKEWDPEPDHSMVVGTEHARRAVNLDPAYPHGHCSLGFAELWNRRHDRSIAEYKTALDLDPSYANAHVALGRALMYSGRADETIKSVERGLRLDPYYNDIHLLILAQAYFQLGQYEEAVKFLRRRLIRKPDTDVSRILLAACYGHMGRKEEAKSEWQEALRINPNYYLEHRRRILPYKNEEDFERLAEGLRKAGFPN